MSSHKPVAATLMAILATGSLACSAGPSQDLATALEASQSPPTSTEPADLSWGEREHRRLLKVSNETDALLAESADLVDDAGVNAYIDRIVADLLPEGSIGPSHIRVRVVADMSENAVSLANGSIYLTSAMMAAVSNEAELALCIGHELAHFIENYVLLRSQEANNRQTRKDASLSIVALTGAAGPAGLLVGFGAAALYAGIEDMRAVDRAHQFEFEADAFALKRMAKAGYDTTAALELMTRLQQRSANSGATADTTTHPTFRQRTAALRNAGAMVKGTAGERRLSDYLVATAPIALFHARFAIKASQWDDARAAIDRYDKVAKPNSQRHFLLGELARLEKLEPNPLEAALSHYSRALEVDKDHPPSLREFGLASRDLGRTAAAKDALSRYLQVAPEANDAGIIRVQLAKLNAD